MAESTKIKINSKAVRALLTSSEARADLYKRGEAIAASAGTGFGHTAGSGGDRARHYVFPTDAKAWYRQRKFHILEKALDAGRRG